MGGNIPKVLLHSGIHHHMSTCRVRLPTAENLGRLAVSCHLEDIGTFSNNYLAIATPPHITVVRKAVHRRKLAESRFHALVKYCKEDVWYFPTVKLQLQVTPAC